MGIRQLWTYVDQHHNILFKDEICLSETNLVFDGGCLYHTLVRNSSKRFGGCYDKMYKVYQDFFEKLSKLQITPYVVMDGGSNIPLKLGTIISRFEESINALKDLTVLFRSQNKLPQSLLSEHLFIEVMQNMGIKFVVANSEADLLTAAIANRIGCPVVTADSDFYVTNVHHGVLTMDSIMKLGDNATCHCYKLNNLAGHLKLNVKLLPFIGILMGNDYTSKKLLDTVQKSSGIRNASGRILPLYPRMQSISEYLKQFNSVEGVIDDLVSSNSSTMDEEELRHIISEILTEFDEHSAHGECNKLYDNIIKPPLISSEFLTSSENTIQEYIELLSSHGLIHSSIIDVIQARSHFMDVQCENTAKKCSSELSLELRKYIYIITLAGLSSDDVKVTEYKRAGCNYKKVSICISVLDIDNLCQLKQIPFKNIILGNYNKAEKLNFLSEMVGFSSKQIHDIDSELQIFVISIKYWVVQSSHIKDKVKIEHIQALLICFLQLRELSSENCNVKNKCLDLNTAHHFCRWQSILDYLIMLNDLLLRPMQRPSLKSVTSGNLLHHIFARLTHGNAVSAILLMEQRNLEDFHRYLNLVINGIEEHIQFKNSEMKSPCSKNGKVRDVSIKQKKCTPASGNRFALLMTESDSADDNTASD